MAGQTFKTSSTFFMKRNTPSTLMLCVASHEPRIIHGFIGQCREVICCGSKVESSIDDYSGVVYEVELFEVRFRLRLDNQRRLMSTSTSQLKHSQTLSLRNDFTYSLHEREVLNWKL